MSSHTRSSTTTQVTTRNPVRTDVTATTSTKGAVGSPLPADGRWPASSPASSV